MYATLITLVLIASLGACTKFYPEYNVYSQSMAGKAALAQAESTRQVRVLEARAKQEAAAMEGQAELIRAQASAQAIGSLKRELGSSEAYLRWLYIKGLEEQGNSPNEKTVVYIPTDGLVPLPISEAPRLK